MTADSADGTDAPARPREPAGAGRAVTGWAGFGRSRHWLAAHPLLTDGLLALMLCAVLAPKGVNASEQRIEAVVFTTLLCLPLIWRRRHPLTVFGAICVVAAVQWVLGLVLAGDAVLLVALYTVVSRCSRTQALVAAGVLEIGVALAVIRWAPAPGSVVAFIFLSGMTTAAFVLGVNIQTRRAYLASLVDRALRAEHERDQQSRIAAANERARIAREMHDIVAHNLSVMIALADGAAFAARETAPAAENAARQVSDTGRAALAEMHRLLGVLREGGPAMPLGPQPGVEQIDDLVAQVRATGLTTVLTVTGKPFALPSTAGLTIYRLVQEALTNVLKHAHEPSRATVVLRYDEPLVELEIIDDGTGTTDQSRDTAVGHGLAGMRERAAVFGGELQAGPRPVGGWRVAARLDLGQTDPARSSS